MAAAEIRLTRDLFLWCMSVIYLFAFTSLFVQIPGRPTSSHRHRVADCNGNYYQGRPKARLATQTASRKSSEEGKNKEAGGDKIYLFVSRENKRTGLVIKCVDVYV